MSLRRKVSLTLAHTNNLHILIKASFFSLPSLFPCHSTSKTKLTLLGRTLEETAALFDGEAVPQEIVAMGGEAATMTMTRAPAFLQETEIRYEKAHGTTDFLEMQRTPSKAPSYDSRSYEGSDV